MTKKPKLISSIRAKLVSAVAMLLVAVIMVVSSTYAWFTLSTAPEITGITTQIGANGALEMALMPGSGVLGEIVDYDPANATEDSNRTWGNLVNLTTGYGLDKIVLYPSALKYANDTKTELASDLLQGPTYGPDGRLSGFTAGVTGGYDKNEGVFYPGFPDGFGVQAVGRASGMTTRELMHRDAVSAASAAASEAKTAASDALKKYGNDLGNLAIEHALASGTEAYDATDLEIVTGIITDMETLVLPALEKAYLYHVLAAATADEATPDETCTALEAAIEGGATLTTIQTTYAAQYGKLSDTIVQYIEDSTDAVLRSYNEMLATVTAAKSDLPATKDSYTWAELSTPLAHMVDMGKITVNGKTVTEVKENQNEFIKAVLKDGGLFINIVTGGGLFADLADHCGDYKTAISMNIVYGGDTYEDMPATMTTATTISPVYLTVAYGISNGLDVVAGSNADNPLTEFYGYILDLAFRTNATDSDLMLQTNAENRIYTGDTAVETMGAGSTMTFKASEDMTYQQVVALMEAFNLVFFTRDTGGTNTIIAKAALGDITYNETDKEYTGNVYLLDAEGKMISEAKSKLMDLEVNTATALSVLVYLDGTKVGNEHVSATSATSLIGKLNLQFSSSATLVPMEYDGIQATEYDVEYKSSAPGAVSGVTFNGEAKAVSNKDYTFELSDLPDDASSYVVAYTVGDAPVTSATRLTANAEGKYTIPSNAISGDIAIYVIDPTQIPTP